MPDSRLHKKLWKMAFGRCGYPLVSVDKQMDEYSQKMPGVRHRLKDHDPLRAGDYEDPQPELDMWRIVYRIYHISVDCWWTELSKESREKWRRRIKGEIYPSRVDEYFWKIISQIAEDSLGVYKVLNWQCEPLPIGWVEYIKDNRTNDEK